MRLFSFPSRRQIPALVVIAAAALAGCGQGPSEKPTTTAPKVATEAKKRPEPAPRPTRPSLPADLATDSLTRFETAPAGDARMRALIRDRAVTGRPVRVALLLPLTGRAATVGRMMLDAAQMALFDQGVGRLMLIPEDTGSTPDGARAAAQKAVGRGADVILGPLFGAHVPVVADVARSAGVRVLAFSNDASRASDQAIVLGLTPEAQIRRIVGYAARNGHLRIGALLPDSDYGFAVAQALRTAAADQGVVADRIAHYPAGAEASDDRLLQAARAFADYDERHAELERERARLSQRDDEISKQALKRLENLDTFGDPPFDAVLLAEPRSRLATMAPLLAYYDIDPETVRYLGMSSWYGEGLQSEPTLIGAWFPNPDPRALNAFIDRYKAQYDDTPLDIAALAYGAVAMAADLVRTADAGADPFSDERLHDPDGFRAYMGAFRISADNTTERQLSILRVGEQGLEVIEDAPTGFGLLLN